MKTKVILETIVDYLTHGLYTKIQSEIIDYNKEISLSENQVLMIDGKHDLIYSVPSNEFSNSSIETEFTSDIVVFNPKRDIDWEIAKCDILSSLNWNDLKTGEISELENIIYSLTKLSSKIETMSWLNKLFLDYYINPLFVSTLLHTLSHMDYDDVFPNGPTMAMSSLSHEDNRVVIHAVKAFYNWNSKSALRFMRGVEPKADWVNSEWKKVIGYLEKYGDE